MSPEKARLFVVEDDPDYRESLGELLKLCGHEVVAEADTLKGALEAIEALGPVDCALVDGNLSRFSQGGQDGALVAKAFRARFPGVPLLAISGDQQPWSDDPALTKRDGGMVIAEKITQL